MDGSKLDRWNKLNKANFMPSSKNNDYFPVINSKKLIFINHLKHYQ